jgi:nitric oxide reductase NorD protein
VKTTVQENRELDEGIKTLGEKLGRGNLVEEAVGKMRPLLDDEGLKAYLFLADTFASLDPSFSTWLLQAGGNILSPLGDHSARREVLEALREMGRTKWSVVEHACRSLQELADVPREFILRWLRYGSTLADIDQDAALQYFEASIPVLKSLGTERFDLWASFGHEIARMSWKAAKEYFKSSSEVLKKIDPCDLERWARLGIYLVEKSPRIKAAYNAHSLLAAGSGAGKAKKVDLAVQYFKSAPQILSRLSIHDLEEWVEKGLETVETQRDKGTSFFSLQTGTSRMAVEGLVKGLELKDIHTVLCSYAEALRGSKLQIRSSSVFYKNLPGLSRFFSVTDGVKIFLPSRIEVFEGEDLNFKTYKWILTHELAHLLFGTFDINRTDLARLGELQSPLPAFKIFEFLEDERVDYLMGLQYPGLEKDRRLIMEAYLTRMPSHRREVRQSVFETLSFRVSGRLGESAGQDCRLTPLLKEALSKVICPGCSVKEVLDLTIQLYTSLNGEADCAVCENRESPDRVFYRGIIDFELVDAARSGMTRLVRDMTERFYERKMEIAPEHVTAALNRIEEAQLIDSQELLWQIEDSERLNGLFDEVQEIIADMEAERRIRRAVYYDEWDMKLDDYRKDWCRVRELDMPETSPVFYHRTIDENYGIVSLLRRHFGLLRPDRIKRFFREERGDDIDFDALIEAVVERHAGVMPSDRVYIRREKNLRDVSVAFLVDMSYSTGDVLSSGKRIIDVEREGLVLMAEALESIGDRWAVYGFSTHYRDKVDFFVVRDFDEPMGNEVKSRFESIKPIAQTRLGAAIRHANSLLARQGSRIRLLILLSDGRPYDIDYGDADYAVEDTRRALWEGRRKGVNSFCITVDKKSRDYLPYMYGEANYTLIDNIETLPVRLPLIYKRLTT